MQDTKKMLRYKIVCLKKNSISKQKYTGYEKKKFSPPVDLQIYFRQFFNESK